MTDEQIRQILIERKRRERRQQKRANLLEAMQDLICWSGLLVICFMLSVIGA